MHLLQKLCSCCSSDAAVAGNAAVASDAAVMQNVQWRCRVMQRVQKRAVHWLTVYQASEVAKAISLSS